MPAIRSLTLLSAACLAALLVSACGRRGALERPGTSASPTTTTAPASARSVPQSIGLGGGSGAPEAAAVEAGEELSVAAVPPSGTDAPVTTARGARRRFDVPKDPFILDPLL